MGKRNRQTINDPNAIRLIKNGQTVGHNLKDLTKMVKRLVVT